MNKWLELLAGLVLIIGAILVGYYSHFSDWGRWDFLASAWVVLKGIAFWAVIGIGALFVLLGISDLKG